MILSVLQTIKVPGANLMLLWCMGSNVFRVVWHADPYAFSSYLNVQRITILCVFIWFPLGIREVFESQIRLRDKLINPFFVFKANKKKSKCMSSLSATSTCFCNFELKKKQQPIQYTVFIILFFFFIRKIPIID
jgi:hypothetical protein